MGCLSGGGVGPGDPGLMTLRGAEVIRACPVVAVPVSGGERLVALEIARQAVPEVAEKELLRLDFPMIRDRATLEKCYDTAARAVMAVLDSGRDVAMLNLGDPSLYATYSSVQRRVLAAERYQVITIPGVPSFCAVAARLDMSLTKPHLPLHIVPGGYPGVEEALDLPGAKVLMKAGKEVPRLKELLAGRPGLTARMVTDCGLPTQRVYRDLREADGPTGYFSTVIIEEE
mgnify:FL=1